MKNLFFVLVFTLVGAGCVPQQQAVVPQETETADGYVFEDQSFSLTLPADFIVESGAEIGYIEPKHEGDFPSIQIALISFQDEPSMQDVLAQAEMYRAGLCGQTDACGTMIEWNTVDLDGRQALVHVIEYPGRSLEEPEGYIREYYYSVPIARYEPDPDNVTDDTLYPKTYIQRFRISLTDEDDEAALRQSYDAIMASIKFK